MRLAVGRQDMNRFYVACELGAHNGRVVMGSLEHDKVTLSEVHTFANQPVEKEGSLTWNIEHLYYETLNGLHHVGSYEEPISGISFSSWSADYLLFDGVGQLISPTYHRADARAEEGMSRVLSRMPWEEIYAETGVQPASINTAFQLAAEKSRRLSKARHLLPVADGFNYILTGVPRVEVSMACRTQLYNPQAQGWSDRMLGALSLPQQLLPPLVEAGTKLGFLNESVAREIRLEDACVVASCSHDLAAALAGLPVERNERWGYLSSGPWITIGTEVDEPIINERSRDLKFTNEVIHGNRVNFHQHAVGLWILNECRRKWEKEGRGLDEDMLGHLAGAVTPFESLIDIRDPRFLGAGDMPEKVQSFCRDTLQTVPRKPGAITRCILESLALFYRRVMDDMDALTGRKIWRLFVLNGNANSLLNHFTANALQVPVVVVPQDAAALGNIVVQALALGHIRSLEEARQIVRNSIKVHTIQPHGNWNEPYQKLKSLAPS